MIILRFKHPPLDIIGAFVRPKCASASTKAMFGLMEWNVYSYELSTLVFG